MSKDAGPAGATPLRRILKRLQVAPQARVRLKDTHASQLFGWSEQAARERTHELKQELTEGQYRLSIDGRFGLLIVLQAIDGGGKDSTVHHVLSAFSPQGCRVSAFKEPSTEEQRHDFLWRIHREVPMRGEIGIFNRSHYEDVLIVRVDELVPKQVWQRRYRQINDFERTLHECDIRVLKLFLHISRDEQKRRFQERVREPRKQWKFEPGDLRKRAQWPQYRAAFEDMLTRCSAKHAPWFVVPSDVKWLRDLLVAQLVHQALAQLPLSYPAPRFDPRRMRVR